MGHSNANQISELKIYNHMFNTSSKHYRFSIGTWEIYALFLLDIIDKHNKVCNSSNEVYDIKEKLRHSWSRCYDVFHYFCLISNIQKWIIGLSCHFIFPLSNPSIDVFD